MEVFSSRKHFKADAEFRHTESSPVGVYLSPWTRERLERLAE